MRQIKQNNNVAVAVERKLEMAYKKPEIVAKSTTQHSYVAGCPVNKRSGSGFIRNGVKYDYGCIKCERSGN